MLHATESHGNVLNTNYKLGDYGDTTQQETRKYVCVYVYIIKQNEITLMLTSDTASLSKLFSQNRRTTFYQTLIHPSSCFSVG